MAISLIKEEGKHILKILPVLLRKDVEFKDSLYNVLGETFTKKDDFSELKGIVKDIGIKVSELADARKEIRKELNELANAQKRTEIKVEELAEAQKKTEIKMEELAEAQKKTEMKMKELAEAQKKTEIKVEELANTQIEMKKELKELTEAQKKTEIEIRALIVSHESLTVSHETLKKEVGEIKKQVGGLSHTVGFRLEDDAFKSLPELLKRDFGIIIEDRLKRQYILDNEGKYIEINIIGSAKRNGKKLTIIGEAKSQLSKNDVDDFVRKKIKRIEGLYEQIFPLLVTYMTSEPDVEKYIREKEIALYYSYDF